ncbi:hypothetical protein B1L04_06260 [Microcystis aeruginosa KW]|uniref:Glycosyltransferase RgtA/B/C/D-like domain-containing protein n=2 Tax=Microcystis aeruginosa TaxID=1126 RepID=A0A1V4BX13_MICAE|nr:hypothetical protein [Microcystis aeruginosa]OPF19007.1 hypothetical protein B1L04_06260 [Microcystis aeruginosa KW]
MNISTFVLAVFFLVLAVSVWIAKKSGFQNFLDKFVVFSILPLSLTVILLIGLKVLQFPLDELSHNRLIPTFAFNCGYRQINALETGPVLFWAYGPIGPLFYWPATLANSPTIATMIGGVINITLFFLPLVFLCASFSKIQRKSTLLYGTLIIYLCLFWVENTTPLKYSAFRIHVDSPSLMLAAMACIAVYWRYKNMWLKLNAYLLPMSALLSILAIWTKHNLIFLPLAIITYLILTKNYDYVKIYTGYLMAFGVIISSAIFLLFSPDYLYFSMFKFMANLPNALSSQTNEKFNLIKSTFYELMSYLVIYLIIIIINIGVTLKIEGSTTIRKWLYKNNWLIFFLVTIYMLPVAFSSRLKWGGDINSYSVALYFLLLTVVAIFLEIIIYDDKVNNKVVLKFSRLVKLFIVFGLAVTISISYRYIISVPAAINFTLSEITNNNPLEMSYNYSIKHPNSAYFPDYLLSSIMAEGKLYHSMRGVYDRDVADLPLTNEHFREYIPSDTQSVAFFEEEKNNKWQQERTTIIKNYLPELSEKISIEELPGWSVYVRSADN